MASSTKLAINKALTVVTKISMWATSGYGLLLNDDAVWSADCGFPSENSIRIDLAAILQRCVSEATKFLNRFHNLPFYD